MYTLSPIYFLMCSLDRFLLSLPVQKCEIPKCVGPTRENNQKTKKICQCVYATFMCDFLWILISSLNLPLLKLINDLCLNFFPYNCSTHPFPPHTHTHTSLPHTPTPHTHTIHTRLNFPPIHLSNFLSFCLCMFISLTFGVSSCPHLTTLHPFLSNYLSIYISVCVLSCPD